MRQLEQQLDLAHRLLAKCEAHALKAEPDKRERAQADVETAKGLIETIELHIGCRDAGEDWVRRLEKKKEAV